MNVVDNTRFYFNDLLGVYNFLAIHLIAGYYFYDNLSKDKTSHALDKFHRFVTMPKWMFPVIWTFVYLLMCLSVFFIQYRWDYMDLWVYETLWIIFIVHTVGGVMWSFLFFKVQWYPFSFILSGVLFVMIATFFALCFWIDSMFHYVSAFLALPMLIWEGYLVMLSTAIALFGASEVTNKDIQASIGELAQQMATISNTIQNNSTSAGQHAVPSSDFVLPMVTSSEVPAPPQQSAAFPGFSMPVSNPIPHSPNIISSAMPVLNFGAFAQPASTSTPTPFQSFTVPEVTKRKTGSPFVFNNLN